MPDQTKDKKTQDLPELLREIAEVAPGVVRTWIDSGTEDRVFKLSFISWRIYCQQNATEFKRANRAIIQAALQEAIEERGWTWDLKSSGIATINRPGVPAAEKWSTGEADDPATALAIAFLQALRADQ